LARQDGPLQASAGLFCRWQNRNIDFKLDARTGLKLEKRAPRSSKFEPVFRVVRRRISERTFDRSEVANADIFQWLNLDLLYCCCFPTGATIVNVRY
jgi:hypothetical protein